MKKILIWILCLMAGLLLFTGCSGDRDHTFTAKTYTSADTELSGVNINVRDRTIDVARSENNQIHIDYFESEKERYSISISDGQVLHMTADNQKEWTDYIGGKPAPENRKISVQLPDALLNTLALSTTNEDISISPLTVTNSISVSNSGGDVDFDKLNVGKDLSIQSKNGDVSGTLIGSYDDFAIDCKVKKGESSLPEKKDGGKKTLTVSGNNGDIDIQLTAD